MRHHRFVHGLLLGFAATLGTAATSAAQCLDWVSGFQYPGNGVRDFVEAMQVFDDGTGPALYVAGGLRNIGPGIPACAGRWDGTSWTPIGVSSSSSFHAFAVFDSGSGSELYAGGYFLQVDGTPLQYVARWSGSSWVDVGGGTTGPVFAMEVFDDGTGDALYAGGSFNTAGGAPASKIARWDGSSWSPLGAGLDGTVQAMATFDDGSGNALYVGGSFANAGSAPASRAARWDGTSWSAVGSFGGTQPWVNALAVFDDGSGPALYATGHLFYSNSTPINHIAKWDGANWNNIGGLGDEGIALAVHDDGSGPALYVGGRFWDAGGVPARHVARWDGSSWSSLGVGIQPVSQRAVRALTVYDDGNGERLYVGGEFLGAGEKPSSNIAAWSTPCHAPIIHTPPADQTAVFNEDLVFEVYATGTATVTYQWRHDGVPISNGPGIEGADTDTMTFYWWSYDDAGAYDCVVTNPWGTTISPPGMLTVPVGGTTGNPIPIEKVLYPPEPVPDQPGLDFTLASRPVQASTGEVAAHTRVGTDYSLTLIENGNVTVLVREQDPAPGLPGYFFKDGSSFEDFDLAPGGLLAFEAEIEGPGVDNTNRKGIWYRDANGIQLVLREGDPAVGFTAGSWRTPRTPIAGEGGHFVFRADVYDGTTFVGLGLWRYDSVNGVQLVVKQGDSIPGTSTTLGGLGFRFPMTAAGEVFFTGSIAGGGGTVHCLGSPGSLELVAATGQVAPGAPVAGSTFSGLTGDSAVLTAGGDVVFRAVVAEPGGATGHVLYRWSNGTLAPILAAGDVAPITGPPTFTYLAIRPMDANEAGQIVFHANVASGCNQPCAIDCVFFWDGTTSHLIATDNDPGLFPFNPPLYGVVDFTGGVVNASGQVVVEAQHQHISSVTTYGWTAAQGLFPLGSLGEQFELPDGSHRTVGGSGLWGPLGNTHDASASFNDQGSLIFSLGFSNQTQGVFRANFATSAATYNPCAAIVRQPANASVLTGTELELDVLAGGASPLMYQWYRDGMLVSDGPGVSGASTDTLVIASAQAGDQGAYTVLVTNGCGSQLSEEAFVSVGLGTSFCDATDGALASCPCGNAGSPDSGCDNAQGTGGVRIDVVAQTTSPVGATMTGNGFSTMGTPTAMVIRSNALDPSSPVAFGDGLRCISTSPLVRLAVTVATGGTSTHAFGHGAAAGSGVFRYQIWYRNTPSTFCDAAAAFNLSNGTTLTW